MAHLKPVIIKIFEMMHNLQTEWPVLLNASLNKFENKNVTSYM